MTKILLFLSIIFLIISCGQKSEESAKSRVVISSLFHPDTAGGLMIYGRDKVKKNIGFGIYLKSDRPNPHIILPKGLWEFAAITWSGETGNLSGVTRCGTRDKLLSLDYEPLEFTLEQSRCGSSDDDGDFPSHKDFYESPTKFHRIIPRLCRSLLDGSCSAYPPGIEMSYRVVFSNISLSGTKTPGLSSNCYKFDVTGVGQENDLRIPVGTDDSDEGIFPFPVSVAFYKDNSCSGDLVYNYKFDKGLINKEGNGRGALKRNAITSFLNLRYVNAFGLIIDKGDRLIFEDTAVGSYKSTVFTVTNGSSTSIGLLPSFFNISGNSSDISVEINDCLTAVAPGETCNITIDFSPSSIGVNKSILKLESGNNKLFVDVIAKGV